MKAIRHTGIVVSDLKKGMRFYRDLLGFKVIKKRREKGKYINSITGLRGADVTTVKMAASDDNLIELLYFHSYRKRQVIFKRICDTGISHIAFEVNNIEAEYERLSKKNVAFISPPKVSPDGFAKVAFLRDMDDSLIELVEVLK